MTNVRKKRPKNNICQEPSCRNKCAYKTCETCVKRKQRDKNPMFYAYKTLRDNTYRKHGRAWFELTFEEFKQYAIETDYLGKKGITKTGYHIDRIDPTMGYFIGNIRPLTNTLNQKVKYKKLNYVWDDEEGKMVAFVTTMEIDKPDDLPF